MSSLVKKVFQLEQESSRLFKSMVSKDKKIRDQELTIAMFRKEIKILQETIKVNAREKSQLLILNQRGEDEDNSEEDRPVRLQDLNVFHTEVEHNATFYQKSPLARNSTKPIEHIITSHKSITVELQSNDLLSNNPSHNLSSHPSNHLSNKLSNQLSKHMSHSKTKELSINEEKLSKQNR